MRDLSKVNKLKKLLTMEILILCTGNSCRSQMAHGFLKSFDKRLTVSSAGTQAAGRLNEKAVEVMMETGLDISHHTSDPVDKYLGEEWDYVITVCAGLIDIKLQEMRPLAIPDEILLQYIDKAELEEFKKSNSGILSITVYAEKQN